MERHTKIVEVTIERIPGRREDTFRVKLELTTNDEIFLRKLNTFFCSGGTTADPFEGESLGLPPAPPSPTLAIIEGELLDEEEPPRRRRST